MYVLAGNEKQIVHANRASMLSRCAHTRASLPALVTACGIAMLLRASHLKKECVPISVTPFGMLTALSDWRQANRERIAARATLFEDVIQSLDGWNLLSTGAYFGYVRHPQAGSEPSLDVARRLAREVGVLTIPGTFFGDGQDDFLRFAFANAGRDVIAGLPDRLAGF